MIWYYEELEEDEGLTPEEQTVAKRLLNAYTAEEKDIAVVDELLYELHGMMAGKGREGLFSAYLRQRLGWTHQRPDKVARRRIARHQFRVGLISHGDYQRVMGNAPASGPLRPASSLPTEDGSPTEDGTPPSDEAHPSGETETFSFDVQDDPEATPLQPARLTEEDTGAASDSLDHLESDAATVMLQRRIVLPAAQMYWLKSALKRQKRRHKVATYTDLLFKLALCGYKPAEPGDGWEETHDEIMHGIGLNPASAFQPDPDYDCAAGGDD